MKWLRPRGKTCFLYPAVRLFHEVRADCETSPADFAQWYIRIMDAVARFSGPCLTRSKYIASSLGTIAGGWGFLAVRALILLLVLLMLIGGSLGLFVLTFSSYGALHCGDGVQ